MIFITNKGSQSPKFGGEYGENIPYEYKIPEHSRINGIYGHSFTYVRSIGFYYRKLLKTPEFGNPNIGQPF